MKTAMQEVATELLENTLIKELKIGIIITVVDIMTRGLEKEKQQIIDAQNYSQRGVTGEIYYEMTFKND